MHMIGHRMLVHQFHTTLATLLPEHLSNVAKQRTANGPQAMLRDKHNVTFAVPSHMGLTSPLSHDDLLPFESGDSSKRGHLLHLVARRNIALASVTA